jgi:porin
LFGAWGYTAKFDNSATIVKPLPGDQKTEPRRGNVGAYVRGEATLHDNQSSNVAVFGRLGYASGDFNLFSRFISAGLNWRGALRARPNDVFGVAFAGVGRSDNAKLSGAAPGVPPDDWEVAIELTYQATLFNRLTLQPNVQYIINPGLDPTVDNAFVIGLRFVLELLANSDK